MSPKQDRGRGQRRDHGGRRKRSRSPRRELSGVVSRLLRHEIHDHHLHPDASGFVSAAALLRARPIARLCRTEHGLMDLDFETRFEKQMRGDGLYIRTRQGHSVGAVQDDIAFETVDANRLERIPEWVVHGTQRTKEANIDEVMGTITAHGLIPGGVSGRSTQAHVHFATEIECSKKTSTGFVWLHTHAFIREGGTILRSSASTFLCPEVVPPKYLVLHLAGEEPLYTAGRDTDTSAQSARLQRFLGFACIEPKVEFDGAPALGAPTSTPSALERILGLQTGAASSGATSASKPAPRTPPIPPSSLAHQARPPQLAALCILPIADCDGSCGLIRGDSGCTAIRWLQERGDYPPRVHTGSSATASHP